MRNGLDFNAIAALILAELEANGASSSEQVGLALGMPAKSVKTYLGRLAYQQKIQRQVIQLDSNKRMIWWPLGLEIPAEPEPEGLKRKATPRDLLAWHAACERIGSLTALCRMHTTYRAERAIGDNI